MSNNNNSTKSLRSIFWPINGKEHIKFLPLALMMFFILFNYSMLRSLKEAFIVTAIGAEAISFLKTYFVFPSAILMTVIYYKLCNMMDSKKVFYVIVTFFLAYFTLFATVLFPQFNQMIFSDAWAQGLIDVMPRFQWFIRIIQLWPYTSFFIMAELWGSTMIALFFWQMANSVTSPSEAKRHYAMYALLGNGGLIGTSYLLKYALDVPNPNYDYLFGGIIISTVAIALLYAFVQNYVEGNAALMGGVVGVTKKKKQKLGIGQSIKMVFSSKYLGLLALLLICYGISCNVIEAVWKERIKALCPTKAEYAAFMGNFQFYLGLMTMFFTLVGSNILRLVSWTTAALLTPAMFALTAGVFFLFIVAVGAQGLSLPMLGFSMSAALALWYAVMIGAVQNVLSKATKYSLFDATQKMAYMPLDEESKTKGMSAVEVIGGRFGKMGGGVMTSTLLMLYPSSSLLSLTPILAAICAIIVVLWIGTVFELGKEYHAALDKRQESEAA